MSAPEFPRRVSVAEVVHNARCELYDAVRDNIYAHPWLEQWAAAFDFSFKVDRNINASADTTYLIPVQFGAFTLGINADLKQSAAGTYALGFSITNGLGQFDAIDCSRLRAAAETPQRLLNGEIGLRRWLDEVIPQMEVAWLATEVKWETVADKARHKYAGSVKSLGYTIEFGVTAEGSLLPSWSLTFPNGRQFKPALDFSASRIVTHQLIIALTPIGLPPPPAPVDLTGIRAMVDGKESIVGRRVCITNSEQSEKCFFDDPKLKKAMDEATKKIKLAEEKKQLAVEDQKKSELELRTVQQEQPGPLKNVPVSDFLKYSDEKILALPDLKEPKKVLEIRNRLKDADERIKEADQDRQNAVTDLETKHAKSRAAEYEAAAREANAEARARARAESEAETERRLQQIIQQQLLRDAFRQ